MMICVNPAILAFADLAHVHTTPGRRTSGFAEIPGQKRGEGDRTDLVANLVLAHRFGERNRMASTNVTFGRGDEFDLAIWMDREETRLNVKTSTYRPFRDGLHLCIKEEELPQPIDGYIQVFVHLDEGSLPPHVHVAGYCMRSDHFFREPRYRREIPRTGHPGVVIPVDELSDFSDLLWKSDRRYGGVHARAIMG